MYFWTSQELNSYKTARNFKNNRKFILLYFSALQNSMAKLCSEFLNVKKKWKLVEKINAQFWSALKWERV